MIKDIIEAEIRNLLRNDHLDFVVERSLDFGDYATNVALVSAKELKKSPRETADFLAGELRKCGLCEPDGPIEKIEVAGPGFINFYVKGSVVLEHVKNIGDTYGKINKLNGEKTVIEYTDPNPFKEFHIGHLMTNAIGESLARILETSGAEVKRACYQGDVGMHVAKTVWGLKHSEMTDAASLGRAYALGSKEYEEHKQEITEINKKIYDRSDPEINKLYDEGKKISLDYFETIYKKLGTKFDFFFFESKTGPFGKQIVEEHLAKGVFEKSDGAVVFRGENYRLHTRVFINSEGIPTYEAKELGLAKIKFDAYPYERSIVVTGNEVNDYFRVLLAAMKLVFPELAERTKHISHGMLRLPTGKMSSRTGDVVTAESLISQLKEIALVKIADRNIEDKGSVAEKIAIGAIKYAILRQSPGKDIIFDLEKSVSFEGDSGAYLQYAYVRTQSILRKAGDVAPDIERGSEALSELERFLFEGLPNALEMAAREYSPNYIAAYLVDLCRAFNAYYEKNQVLENEHTPYRLALVSAVGTVLKNGLELLGIPVVEKM